MYRGIKQTMRIWDHMQYHKKMLMELKWLKWSCSVDQVIPWIPQRTADVTSRRPLFVKIWRDTVESIAKTMFNHDSCITTDMFNPIHIDYDNSYYSIPFGLDSIGFYHPFMVNFGMVDPIALPTNTSNQKTWEEHLAWSSTCGSKPWTSHQELQKSKSLCVIFAWPNNMRNFRKSMEVCFITLW